MRTSRFTVEQSARALQQLLGRSTVTIIQRCARISDEMVQCKLERAAFGQSSLQGPWQRPPRRLAGIP